MNPTGTITAFALFCIGSGYLWIEGCISIAAKYSGKPPTDIASFAAKGAPLLVAAVVLWLAWALYQERPTDARPKRKFHIAVGILGCASLVMLYLFAGLSMVGTAIIKNLR
jgi:hypothetical protein